jgi:hypothetical protein
MFISNNITIRSLIKHFVMLTALMALPTIIFAQASTQKADKSSQ